MQLSIKTVADLMQEIAGNPFLEQIDDLLVGNLAFKQVWCRIVLQPITYTDAFEAAVYPNLELKLIPVWEDGRVLNFASMENHKLERIADKLQSLLQENQLVLASYPSTPVVTMNFCNTVSLLVGQAEDTAVNKRYLGVSLHNLIVEYLQVAKLLQRIVRGEYTSLESVQEALVHAQQSRLDLH